MNFGEFIGWWLTRGLIGWLVFLVITFIAIVWFFVKGAQKFGENDPWSEQALDTALNDVPTPSKGRQIFNGICDIVVWPYAVLRGVWIIVRTIDRAIEIRDKLYMDYLTQSWE